LHPNKTPNHANNSIAIQKHLQKARAFEQQCRWEDAEREYCEAIRLGLQAAWIHFKLGAIIYLQRRYEEAIEQYKQGLSLEPGNASAYADLGKLYEKEGRFDEALLALEQTLAIEPTLPKAKRRKKRVLEAIERYRQRGEELLSLRIHDVSGREIPPEWDDLDTLFIAPFEVKFRMATEGEFVTIIYKILMKSYREIGSDLGYYPTKVPVVVYSDNSEYVRACAEAGIEVPTWSAGVYDGHTIRIQARNMGATTGDCPKEEYVGLLCENLAHEYTHLLVDKLTSGRCPAWLNEGLAEYEAKELFFWQREQLFRTIQGKQQIPLKHLEHGFGRLIEDQSRLAYLQAFSVVEFIVNKFGIEKVRQLLGSLSEGKSIDEVLPSSLGIGYNALEARWLKGVRNS